MPAPLSEANRRSAHARAKKSYGVKKGNLYLVADDGSYWGPIACVPHRLHPERQIERLLRDAEGRITRWHEPDVHQVGQEVSPIDGEGVGAVDDGYPGYQPTCDLCADQVWDTIDHMIRVEMEQARAG